MNEVEKEPMTFEPALAHFLERAQAQLDAHRTKHFPNNAHKVLTIERGRRYVRVVVTDGPRSRWVHCFIDTTNGDVLKPDGWKGPTKGARGNIFAADPIAGVTPYGAARLR